MANDIDIKELNFLPSLPMHSERVKNVINIEQFSHRNDKYKKIFAEASEMLVRLLGSDHYFPVISAGSGTFANEMMIASIVPYTGKSLVLSNGEFGRRIIEQSTEYRDDVKVLDFGFGKPFDLDAIRKTLKEDKDIEYVFFVACETSAGMMNPVSEVCSIAEEFDVKVGMDAISAIGVMPIDFSSKAITVITLTSGKALAGVPGIAIALVNPDNLPATKNISHVLDLGFQVKKIGDSKNVHHTMSSLLLTAMHEALCEIEERGLENIHQNYLKLKSEIIGRFEKLGLSPMYDSNSPMVTTFRKPNDKSDWKAINASLKKHGVNVYDKVAYLMEKDLFQVATMGPSYTLDHVDVLEAAFKQALTS